MFSLNGKSAIITGGGSGIGLAISKAFAKQGAHVSILEVDAQAGEKAAKEINKENGTAESYTCDVSQQAELKNIFDEIASLVLKSLLE